MLRRIEDLSPDDRGVGGKARGLALAIAAGLRVPRGLVLTGDEPPPSLEGIFVVRSSASLEDAAQHAAPGIFTSVRDVAGDELAPAVAQVRASLRGPTAVAYLEARGLDGLDATMAVIVQEQVAGRAGTAWSRAPGGERGVLVEIGEARVLVDGEVLHGQIPDVRPAMLHEIADAALRLERALGGPADVELVAGELLWIVQARRIPAAGLRPPVVGAAELAGAHAFSRAEPDTVWTWDAEHNPAPLSLAQAGLVALVDEARAATVRQRVVLGYLYTAPGGAAPTRLVEPGRLAQVYRDEIRPAFEEDLARMGHDLEETLRAYISFYRRYALELGPSLARARDVSVDVPPAVVADLAPGWDVAEPTYGERFATPVAAAWPAALRDVDDLFFARAQGGVRRALLAQAARLGLAGDDVFDLPLAEVRAGAVVDGAARARQHREERRRLEGFTPPAQIVGGRGLHGLPAVSGPTLRGRGIGGRARGRVVKLAGRVDAPPPGHILVAATIIPTMAPLLAGARAVVAEHGGLLGHGVALARELGVPCLVGCVGALTALEDGDELWVDADAGVAVRLTRRESRL